MGLDRPTVRTLLTKLLSIEALMCDDKPLVLKALDLFVTINIDFPDAYHAALLLGRGETNLYSFDRDFDHIPGLTRIEPAVTP